MGLFGKITEAKSNQGGVYFEPGLYVVECKAVKTGQTRDNRPFFVAEFVIKESTNPLRVVGSSVSWMVMMNANIETALGNIKGFAAAIFDIPEHTVDEAGVEAMIAADNPCNGMLVRAEAVMIKTKKGEDFTKLMWSPYKQAA